MVVNIGKNHLVFDVRQMTETEKNVFNTLIFPDSLRIKKKELTCSIHGSGQELYELLCDLSYHFDMELM